MMGECLRPFPAVGEVGADHRRDALGPRRLLYGLQFCVGVGGEAVDGDDARHPIALHILQMAGKVDRPPSHRRDVLGGKLLAGNAAMHLERPHRGDDHRRVGPEPGHAALDVEELLGPQIGAEAGLGDRVVAELQPGAGGDHRVAAVGDVGERPAVDEGRVALERLHQVGLQRVLEQHRHRPVGVEVGGGHRLAVAGLGRRRCGRAGARGRRGRSARQKIAITSEADGDVEAVLARESRWRRRRASDDPRAAPGRSCRPPGAR